MFGSLSESDEKIVENELEKYKYEALSITDSYSGSIIIEAELSYLAMFAVLAVLEISFKESWKETQTHNKIKKILTSRVGLNSKSFILKFNEKIKKSKKVRCEKIDPTIDFDGFDLITLDLKEIKEIKEDGS